MTSPEEAEHLVSAYCDDDAREAVVESVLRQAHEGGVLLDQQNELGVALEPRHLVDVRRDGLRTKKPRGSLFWILKQSATNLKKPYEP